MIDLDIPTNNPPATDTLLHWMQTGLTPATTATRLTTQTGELSVFLLENTTQTPPVLAYFGPGPPARIPLSHRYTQILVDTSDIDDEDLQVLRTAAATIRGFNAQTVLEQADLEDEVVAGNFFNVTNPGPVNTTTTGGPTPTPTPGGSGITGGTGGPNTATQTAGGALATMMPAIAFGAAAAGAVLLGL